MFFQLAEEMNLRVKFSSPLFPAVFLFPCFWKEGLEIGTGYEEEERTKTHLMAFQIQFLDG